jgi:Flp pilus assembly pilin Flp
MIARLPKGGRRLGRFRASAGVTTIEYGLIIATISLTLAASFRTFQERFMALVLAANF